MTACSGGGGDLDVRPGSHMPQGQPASQPAGPCGWTEQSNTEVWTLASCQSEPGSLGTGHCFGPGPRDPWTPSPYPRYLCYGPNLWGRERAKPGWGARRLQPLPPRFILHPIPSPHWPWVNSEAHCPSALFEAGVPQTPPPVQKFRATAPGQLPLCSVFPSYS